MKSFKLTYERGKDACLSLNKFLNSDKVTSIVERLGVKVPHPKKNDANVFSTLSTLSTRLKKVGVELTADANKGEVIFTKS